MEKALTSCFSTDTGKHGWCGTCNLKARKGQSGYCGEDAQPNDAESVKV